MEIFLFNVLGTLQQVKIDTLRLFSSFSCQVDKILKVIPRERRTFLFSATMTKKVEKHFLPFYYSDLVDGADDPQSLQPCLVGTLTEPVFCSLALKFSHLSTGPETTESSSERPCEVCSIYQILYSRQTAAVLCLHTIQVQGRAHSHTANSQNIKITIWYLKWQCCD